MLAPAVSLGRSGYGIRGLPRVGKARAPRVPTVPYPRSRRLDRLDLNPFRGEPAISVFD